MFKPLVFYSAIVVVLMVALIASRRNEPETVRHRSILLRWKTPDDTQ